MGLNGGGAPKIRLNKSDKQIRRCHIYWCTLPTSTLLSDHIVSYFWTLLSHTRYIRCLNQLLIAPRPSLPSFSLWHHLWCSVFTWLDFSQSWVCFLYISCSRHSKEREPPQQNRNPPSEFPLLSHSSIMSPSPPESTELPPSPPSLLSIHQAPPSLPNRHFQVVPRVHRVFLHLLVTITVVGILPVTSLSLPTLWWPMYSFPDHFVSNSALSSVVSNIPEGPIPHLASLLLVSHLPHWELQLTVLH